MAFYPDRNNYSPEPNDGWLCEANGHKFWGVNGGIGHCYCGAHTFYIEEEGEWLANERALQGSLEFIYSDDSMRLTDMRMRLIATEFSKPIPNEDGLVQEFWPWKVPYEHV